jgi:hypothetical protein
MKVNVSEWKAPPLPELPNRPESQPAPEPSPAAAK